MPLKISLPNFWVLLCNLLLFGISVWISFPEKQEQIGKRHQDLIAHQLITYQLWERYGFLHYQGGLILTYPNPGDKHIKADGIQTIQNSQGEFFYASYPPFFFYSTYFLLKIFHLPIDDQSIRWIGTGFLLLNVLAFFFLFQQQSLLPTAIYLFLPNVLWFHHNVWFLDVQVITFILWGLYFSYASFPLFLFCIFAACFTEWWGIVFSSLFLIYGHWAGKNPSLMPPTNLPIGKLLFYNPRNQLYTLLTILAAIILFIAINVNIVGWNEFWKGIQERFILRIGIQSDQADYFSRFDLKTYIFILWYYARNYLFSLALITLVGIAAYRQEKSNMLKGFFFLLLPVGASIWLHHLVLINWTAAHDFSVLKFSVILPFLVFIVLQVRRPLLKKALYVGTVFLIPIQIYFYYKHTNVPRDLDYLKLAQCIREQYKPSEVAKAYYYDKPLPYLWWKSERIVLRDSLDFRCK